MRVSLEDFFVMSASEISGVRVWFRNPEDKYDMRLVAEYDAAFLMSVVPASMPERIKVAIDRYCKQEGLELE
mgnify:CR=1 FL=1